MRSGSYQTSALSWVGGTICGLAVLLLITTLFGAFYTVNQGERAVLMSFGSVTSIDGPGLHFKMPWVQTTEYIDMRTTSFEYTGKSAIESYSRDQQPAHLSIKVTYHVRPDDAAVKELYSQYGKRDAFEQAVLWPRTLEGVKTVFGQFTAVTAIQDRARLNAAVEDQVRGLVKGPVIIEGVQIQDIAFSDAFEGAVEQRMTAQVEVEKLSMNLEREKKQAEIKIIQAKADEEKLMAYGRGQAAAINLRGQALRDNPALIELTLAEKWNGTLPTTMVPGQSVPFIDIAKTLRR